MAATRGMSIQYGSAAQPRRTIAHIFCAERGCLGSVHQCFYGCPTKSRYTGRKDERKVQKAGDWPMSGSSRRYSSRIASRDYRFVSRSPESSTPRHLHPHSLLRAHSPFPRPLAPLSGAGWPSSLFPADGSDGDDVCSPRWVPVVYNVWSARDSCRPLPSSPQIVLRTLTNPYPASFSLSLTLSTLSK